MECARSWVENQYAQTPQYPISYRYILKSSNIAPKLHSFWIKMREKKESVSIIKQTKTNYRKKKSNVFVLNDSIDDAKPPKKAILHWMETNIQCQCTYKPQLFFPSSTWFVRKFQVGFVFRPTSSSTTMMMRHIFHYFHPEIKKRNDWTMWGVRIDCYKIMKINDRNLTAWWLFIAATRHIRC